MRAKLTIAVLCLLACLTYGCEEAEREDFKEERTERDSGGGEARFKVPIPRGYDWEVSQSWKEHCEECDKKYPYDEKPYCADSHTGPCCYYGWDFNLPGIADRGKPILASGSGEVKTTGYNSGWGNYVVIDHGDNICTRYGHMLDESIAVEKSQKVCQGLKLGEIGKTGNSHGEHLHFQFEECDTARGIRMGFDDGNGVPICTKNGDVYDSKGNYSALKLTNLLRLDCEEDPFGEGELPEGGWLEAQCGSLLGCPLIPNCNRQFGNHFPDLVFEKPDIIKASEYLWSECVIDGKSDGLFHPRDKITRAEALKIALYLFGLMDSCGTDEPFEDVSYKDWYFEVVACGVTYWIVDPGSYFMPEANITFAEAAKMIVRSAVEANVISIMYPSQGHFEEIPREHWAYPYVETLYAYGGLSKSPSHYEPDTVLERGEFALMVAALSPCYCENIRCESGCECDQKQVACVDKEDEEPGTGGDDDDDESDNRSGGDWEDYLEIDCYIEEEMSECDDNDYYISYIRCYLENDSDEKLRINNIILDMNEPEDTRDCLIEDHNLMSGSGLQIVYPHEEIKLQGHFEVGCEKVPSDGELDLVFDLKEKTEDGDYDWHYEVVEDRLEVEDLIEECFNPTTTTTTTSTTSTTTTSSSTTTTTTSTSTSTSSSTTTTSTSTSTSSTTTTLPDCEWVCH